jgi:hypothetical protein
MTISRNISVMAQGASSSGILAGGYGGLGASVSPTTAGNVLFTADGSVWSSTQKIVQSTAVTLTTQTAVDFTSIPSWVKRVTVMFSGASLSGTSSILVQIGDSGGIENTGYASTSTGVTGVGGGTISSTAGYALRLTAAAGAFSGHMFLTNLNGNLWVSSQAGTYDGSTASNVGGGTKTLSAVLDRVRITTINGTDTMDAGSVNILYE